VSAAKFTGFSTSCALPTALPRRRVRDSAPVQAMARVVGGARARLPGAVRAAPSVVPPRLPLPDTFRF
jgi:hypothetical protein